MDDFNFWWYIIAAVLYFLTSRKKKKTPANPNQQNRPQKSSPAKSFEDLLREITEGRSAETKEPVQEPVEVNPSRQASEAEIRQQDIRLEGERRHFADEESRKVYEDSIKMAEGAELKFEAADGYNKPRIFKGMAADEEEDEWTIADEIRDGLSSSEAKKAIIYSEILNRKY